MILKHKLWVKLFFQYLQIRVHPCYIYSTASGYDEDEALARAVAASLQQEEKEKRTRQQSQQRQRQQKQQQVSKYSVCVRACVHVWV